MNTLTLQEKAHEQIVSQILTGDIKPGEWLREQHLARRLDMSPTPVREAFRQLEREGWVEFVPRRGVQLRSFSPEDIEDIYTIREGLEIAAIDLAVKRATAGDWKAIRQAVEVYRIDCEDLFKGLKSDERLCGPVTSDIDFHASLVSATHSQKFSQLADIMNKQILYASIHFGGRFTLDYKEMMSTAHEHMSICNALFRREVRLAEELLRAHLHGAKTRIASTMTDSQALK